MKKNDGLNQLEKIYSLEVRASGTIANNLMNNNILPNKNLEYISSQKRCEALFNKIQKLKKTNLRTKLVSETNK